MARKIIAEYLSVPGPEGSRMIAQNSAEMERAEKRNDSPAVCSLLTENGDVYFTSSLYKDALKCYYKVLQVYESRGDSMQAALIKYKIGRVYYFADLAPVRDFYSQASFTLLTSKEPRYLALGLYIRAFLENNTALKQELLLKALAMQQSIVSKTKGDIKAQEVLAAMLNAMNRPEEALSIVKQTGNKWLQIIYLNNICYEKTMAGSYKEALDGFTQSLKLCKELRNKTLLRNTYENISRVNRLSGNSKMAAVYFQLMHLVEESLYNDKASLEISEFKVKYDAEKKELENKLLRDNERILAEKVAIQKELNIYLIAGCIIVSIILGAVFVNRHQLKLAKEKLDLNGKEILSKNTELENLNRKLHEKQDSLREAQEAAMLANWELNLSTDELTFSEQFQKIFETGDPLLKTNFREIISSMTHPDDRDNLNHFLSVRDTGNSPYELDFRLVINESVKWVRAHKVVSSNNSNSAARIFGTVQDITDFKEKERIKIEMAAQMAATGQLIRSQEEERKRIAAELHDSLGQEILVIKNRALLGIQNEAADDYSSQQFGEINKTASAALSQIREITFNLTPVHLARLGLTETIRSAVSKIGQSGSIKIESAIDDIDGIFPAENNLNFYRIVQEGLNNIIKHSEASRAEISIRKNEDSISIIISDNGKGFNQDITDGYPQGFGMANFSNRINMLKGSLKIKSNELEGTQLSITIPAGEHGKNT